MRPSRRSCRGSVQLAPSLAARRSSGVHSSRMKSDDICAPTLALHNHGLVDLHTSIPENLIGLILDLFRNVGQNPPPSPYTLQQPLSVPLLLVPVVLLVSCVGGY